MSCDYLDFLLIRHHYHCRSHRPSNIDFNRSSSNKRIHVSIPSRAPEAHSLRQPRSALIHLSQSPCYIIPQALSPSTVPSRYRMMLNPVCKARGLTLSQSYRLLSLLKSSSVFIPRRLLLWNAHRMRRIGELSMLSEPS